MEVLRFAVLGLGAGAIYGLAALAVVLVYRGSGVLNFASGATGMVGAFIFYNAKENGRSTTVSWILALGFGLLIGVAIHLFLMRPLRNASALSRLVATLGVFILFVGIASQRWPDPDRPGRILPTETVTLPGDLRIARDRLILLAIGIGLCIVLSLVYRRTPFGFATTAVAENRRAAASAGISPDLVGAVNWALGSALAVAAAVLIVNITTLNMVALTLLIVPALAAALLGQFRSFWLTLAGGLLIGVLESEAAYGQVRFPDWPLEGAGLTIPFVLIIILLIVRGRSLPIRGDIGSHPPRVGEGVIRPVSLLVALAAAVPLITTVFTDSMLSGVSRSAAVALIVLSLVVVTGFAGQVSLAQFALAGLSAWLAAKAVIELSLPDELAVLVGVLGVIPVGMVVGIPSLRTRGANLAVATLGLAVVIEAQIFNNDERTGGLRGLEIGEFRLFGIQFNAVRDPARYALFTCACFVVAALLVANLRRGRAGRRLVAVRSNERAAAALGISVFGAKLYAFGLGAAIAGLGGILLVFGRSPIVLRGTFALFESVAVVLYAVLGGVGFILGAAVGGAVAPGGVVARALGEVLESTARLQIVVSALVLVQLALLPDGVASTFSALRSFVMRLVPRRRPRPTVMATEEVEPPQAAPRSLAATDVTVRFGGLLAVDGVSLRVEPGTVVGLIGPNGAGKTTLLDALNGFYRRHRGAVRLGDRDVTAWSTTRRARGGIGRAFQSLELFETMTVRDNLRTASDRRDPLAYLVNLLFPGRAELSPAAIAAIKEFGLEVDLDRRVAELSFGRRRLVSVARAIATQPSVLLLDEPAAGLDRAEATELGVLVRRLADRWGMAVVLVEHDVELVFDVCDRIAVLDFGRLIAEGSPVEVRHNAAVKAAYLGTEERGAPVAVAGDGARRAASERRGDVVLEASGLAAGYGDLAAARDVDLAVRAGEVVAILGPNGAGKSTTLLALAGELPVMRGTVRCLDVAASAPLHRRSRHGLAFVPQERSVIAGLTARQNLRLAGLSADPDALVFEELVQLLGRPAGLLSGGEQQMLTLERALLRHPRLLLVDELSQGLAPLVTERLLHVVRDVADQGVGVLLVEQYARAAVDIADRVHVMNQGRIVLTACADDLRARPELLEEAYLTAAADRT
jgi:ABC-type branched-subunit amino acid transport system ATPase component/branched-subunit amino acid ABC-type transport system permease component